MANISQYIQQLMSAIYGEEVRGSLRDALLALSDDLLTHETRIKVLENSSMGRPMAVNTSYDNTTSGLTSVDVQGAIDENAGAVATLNNRLENRVRFDLSPAYTSSGTINNMSYGLYFPSIGLVVLTVNLYDTAGDIPKMNNPILTIPSQYRPSGGVSGFFNVSSELPDAEVERGGIDVTRTYVVLNNFSTATRKIKYIGGTITYIVS